MRRCLINGLFRDSTDSAPVDWQHPCYNATLILIPLMLLPYVRMSLTCKLVLGVDSLTLSLPAYHYRQWESWHIRVTSNERVNVLWPLCKTLVVLFRHDDDDDVSCMVLYCNFIVCVHFFRLIWNFNSTVSQLVLVVPWLVTMILKICQFA